MIVFIDKGPGLMEAITAAGHTLYQLDGKWIASDPVAVQQIIDSYQAPPPTAENVNAERDRRLVADFTFQGVRFQRDERSLQRITGAATLAGFARPFVQPGNLRWANPDRDFTWIASDNSLVPMDAHTCFAFGQAAANTETSIIFTAKALREMDPIPLDFADDKWWPK